jgi:hypothetical protein
MNWRKLHDVKRHYVLRLAILRSLDRKSDMKKERKITTDFGVSLIEWTQSLASNNLPDIFLYTYGREECSIFRR